MRFQVGRQEHASHERTGPARSALIPGADPVTMSESLTRPLALEQTSAGSIGGSVAVDGSEQLPEDSMLPPQIRLLKAIIEHLTGHTVQEVRIAQIAGSAEEPESGRFDAGGTAVGRPWDGFGLEYDIIEVVGEKEQLAFSARGAITTDSGSRFEFDFSLSMEREAVRAAALRIRAGDAARVKDPLVINLSGGAVELTGGRFTFDLDADGTVEQARFLGPGSAFLARDTNGDGRINDGSELFGARTGDGFAELSVYDDDANGWIDEGDAIFASLLLWSQSKQGERRLEPLRERGIGAIYLGRVPTPFQLRDLRDGLQGVVRTSGVYLREDGAPGGVHQVDLVVE